MSHEQRAIPSVERHVLPAEPEAFLGAHARVGQHSSNGSERLGWDHNLTGAIQKINAAIAKSKSAKGNGEGGRKGKG